MFNGANIIVILLQKTFLLLFNTHVLLVVVVPREFFGDNTGLILF
jgi:hypothetical protein